MALPSIPPQPLLTALLQQGADAVNAVVNRIWSQWFNTVVTRVQMAPMIITTSYQKNITAALSTQTLLPASANTQEGLYRISYHNDLNTAGGKCTLQLSYTCDGVVRTLSGTQVTNVADPTSGMFLIDPDVNTAITYITTCVIPGGGISYNLSVTLERVA